MNTNLSFSVTGVGRGSLFLSLAVLLTLFTAGCGGGGGSADVQVAPVASFDATPTSGTYDLEVVFTDTSTGDIDSYLWDFGDGTTSTEQDPSHTYTESGEYAVSLTVTGPVGKDTFVCDSCIVVTAPPPAANFQMDPTSGTYDLLVQFTDDSTGPIDGRLWDFGDGATSTELNPSHLYTLAGIYTVSLTVTGPGGTDTSTCDSCIEVLDPPPTAGFDMDPTSGVEDLLVTFTDASTGVITSRLWDFGDGATSDELNPGHLYTEAGVYTVSLLVTGPGGSDTMVCDACITVIDAPPVAEFSANPTSGDGPLTVQLSDLSTGAIDSRLWDFGDPGSGADNQSTELNPVHLYQQPGIYTVSLLVTGPGGTDTAICQSCITVIDVEAPVIFDMPADMTLATDPATCQAVATWDEPSATDNARLADLTGDFSSGDTFPLGSTVVTYTATDAAGNSTSSSFTITVEDLEAPVLADIPADATLSAAEGSCDTIHLWDLPAAADNCPGVTLSADHASGASFSFGTTTVTFTATDASGNTSTDSFSVTVIDTEEPVISQMPMGVVIGNDAGMCGAQHMWADPMVTDNCSGVTLSSDHTPGEIFDVGTTTVTYTATDSSGNSSSLSFTVTVNDTESPLILLMPSDQVLENDPGSCSAMATWSLPLATDNCAALDLTSDYSSGDSFPQGTTQVTYTVMDDSGNSATASFLITVADTEDPALSGMPADLFLENDPGSCGAVVNWDEPLATDNCAGVTLNGDHSSGDFYSLGTTTVIYMAIDSSGNMLMDMFTVTVSDIEDPQISQMPMDVVLENDNGSCDAMHFWLDPIATDNCGGSTLTSDYSPGDRFEVGTTLVSFTATDNSGNTSSMSFSISVTDTEAPTISAVPNDMLLSTDPGLCGATATWSEPVGLDNCAVADLSSDHSSGDSFPLGVTTVTYTALDGSGNSSIRSFTITVEDNEDPAIVGLSTDLILETDPGKCSAVATWAEPSVTDNCPGALISGDYASGATFQQGTTTVIYMAVDDTGNMMMDTFSVTVIDAEEPTLSGLPDQVTMDTEPGLCSASVFWQEPTASDNCGVLTLSSNLPSGTVFPLGDTVVTYTASDTSGNSTTGSFTVTIHDDEAPGISGIPAALDLTTDQGLCTATAMWSDPIPADNCGSVSLSSNFDSGDSFPIGSTTVTYTATDASSNSSSISFVVTVSDEEDPSILGMPADILLEDTTDSCSAVASWPDPMATDNCGTVMLTGDHSPGDSFAVGATLVTYTATDGNGNTSMSSFLVTVEDTVAPAITGMPTEITVTADTGQSDAIVIWDEPLASDNCAVLSFTSTHLPGDLFPVGVTEVTYTAVDNSGNIGAGSFSITVNDPAPVASFIATPMSGNYNLAVNFIDTSIGPIDNWLWDFGDGAVSAIQSPTHTYTQEGDYTVTLVVTGPGGTGSMSCASCIHVTVPPDYLIRASDVSLQEAGTGTVSITFDNNGADVQAWSFGVCHDSARLNIFEVNDGADIALMNNGSSPDFNIIQVHPDGFTVGVVISFTSSFSLSPGFGYELNLATYEGLAVGTTTVDFCDTLGTPAIGTVVVVDAESMVPEQSSGTVEVLESD
ncbi:MAG: HYR domain-containing protein [Planctomycetota bacterium]|nr:HYR domain-containing protein [Planctomycetota bacterium]